MNKNQVLVGAGSNVGPYELLECIGRGGMADVYLGIKRSVSNIRRFYAIKAIRPHMASEDRFTRMLVDEARVMANIRHPNLVNLHEVLEERGHHFIVMDYLRGIDLRRMQKELDHRELKLPLPVALGIIRQAGLGLHYAHEAKSIDGEPLNLVHRDISTHNLFVTFDGFVRVLDFGIAQSSVRQELSESGMLKGKIPYLSPEQAADVDLDRRTDVYSLGVVLYELTTGRRPFVGKNEMQVIQAIVNDEPLRPVSLNRGIPRSLEDMMLTALHKDRNQRFQTTEEFSDALEEVALEEGWHIGERMVGAFIRGHYREYMEQLDRRLSELAAAASRVDGTPSDIMQIDYDDVEERLLDVGPDVLARARNVGNYTLFSLSGAIRETFQYEPILSRTRGVCVLDLADVSRLTSFGIRQWLEMLPRLAEAAERIVLSRMSVAFVNQAVTIPRLTEGIEVASLMAPYRCRNCVHAFDHRLEAGEAIPFKIECPRCHESEAELDEDPGFLAPIADTEAVEPELDILLDELHEEKDEYASRIEKRVIGHTTEIQISGEVPSRTRWDRYLAGVEGEVRVTFDPGAVIDGDSIQKLSSEARKASRDADVGIWNLPASPDDVDLQKISELCSISFASACTECGFEQFREWGLEGESLAASCRRCGAHLERQWRETSGPSEPERPADESRERPRDSRLHPGDASSAEPEPARPRNQNTLAFVATVLLLLIAITAMLLL